MYDRIIHLHAQWVFENERVRRRWVWSLGGYGDDM